MPTCFLHVWRCIVVDCSRLLGLYFLDMAALHFSLISLVDCAFVGHFLLRGFFVGGDYKYKFSSVLYVGVVDTRVGMVTRWVDFEVVVKVMAMKGPMDKY